MPRTPQAFKLTPAEQAALRAAVDDFRAWQSLRASMAPPRNAARLASMGKAARALLKAWSEMQGTPEQAELLAAMQEMEFFRTGQGEYLARLDALHEPLSLAERACSSMVRAGVKKNHRVHEWVRCAATHWEAAGLKPSAAGRFAKALGEAPADLTPAPDRKTIEAALA